MLRRIILAGELGKQFGREHSFDIKTPAEAIRALCANFKDFRQTLVGSECRNVGYRVTVDKEPLGELHNMHNPFSRTIRIVPVLMGASSKGGLLNVVLGAALIGASFFLPGTALFTIGSFAPSLASIAFGMGSSMLLGGISSMLSKQPEAIRPQERPENNPSTYFSGPINTTAQGQCVAAGYGRLIFGSAVISAGITSDDYSAAGVT